MDYNEMNFHKLKNIETYAMWINDKLFWIVILLMGIFASVVML